MMFSWCFLPVNIGGFWKDQSTGYKAALSMTIMWLFNLASTLLLEYLFCSTIHEVFKFIKKLRKCNNSKLF